MNRYYSNLNKEIKQYFKILEPHFPEWLHDYINTKELLKQKYISVTCGTIYSNLFESDFFYSSLDHSVAVALIVWHFTHNKEQTLAGLFHDIATPAFKHCVDFLNGDYMKQESTEDLTTEIIKKSPEIMNLLKRDNIDIYEVNDYHVYPIADNDTPQLSADRLEYSMSNALFTYKLKNIEDIKELSIIYREDRTRYSMQLIADILKKLSNENKISKKDLYMLKESDVIKIIENSKYKEIFDKWRKAKKVKISKEEPKGVYYVHHGAKIRYINPMCKGTRINEISQNAKENIENNLLYNMGNYAYLNFELPK